MSHGFKCFTIACCNFIVIKVTLSICVWRWSCNSLHGSRCWCRWDGGCLDVEWSQPGFLLNNVYGIFCNGFYEEFIFVIIEHHMDSSYNWHVEVDLNFLRFWEITF